MSKNKTEARPMFPVEDLARNAGVPAWELAALRVGMNWAEGKQVAESDFADALNRLRTRPQGGGAL
ncbi:hypothetical protein BerOc1_02975 [Pseudodesulfovibrio hydrargyri]|uniref:Uncharacterized protein n=1 Tax=Pseudodesulfovibrio hydrargyri TaxID=2125990 RepID=A0A1J5MWX8_9BACT|nr:hypothetical protein [Pseudodesulfovibrio hydrargyri]OIQ51030.1 hypothetical protein BerOc1_02975 [Pseudodesulfovibrio hydrargyri]